MVKWDGELENFTETDLSLFFSRSRVSFDFNIERAMCSGTSVLDAQMALENIQRIQIWSLNFLFQKLCQEKTHIFQWIMCWRLVKLKSPTKKKCSVGQPLWERKPKPSKSFLQMTFRQLQLKTEEKALCLNSSQGLLYSETEMSNKGVITRSFSTIQRKFRESFCLRCHRRILFGLTFIGGIDD